ncbi:MAG: hypothetical protein JSS04_16205 [Proteobacteria bacterium]|nr:hypothetical protein [Pseudomonadota bacterium]MBS0525171.1 hypothetical protein [Pseudomonadota bacterium]
MPGRTIALAVAACGWLIASLVAFVLVARFGFFAIALIGLLLWFVCVRAGSSFDRNREHWPGYDR